MVKAYEVGFRKPPKKSQFKKGQSGNPKGRPKNSRNLRMDLTEELNQRVYVTEGGTRRSISRQRGLVKTMIAKALQGDARAISATLGLMLRLLPQPEEIPVEVDLSAEDEAILADFSKRQKRVLKATGRGGRHEKRR
jgi:hypothetical protein